VAWIQNQKYTTDNTISLILEYFHIENLKALSRNLIGQLTHPIRA